MERNSSNSEIRDFVMRERDLAVSEREWKFRLRGYGFGIREAGEARIITSLLGGKDICTIAA